MNRTQPNDPAPIGGILWSGGFWGLAAGVFLWPMLATHAQPSFSEHQVKAVFLFNFAKYVEWPPDLFPTSTAPIVIGLVGQENMRDDLNRAVDGKSINGRTIVVRRVNTDEEIGSCHILFVSSSENARFEEILGKVRSHAILTVGEHEQFTRKGGIINFTLKEAKIRFEIDLNAAQKARLQISSKLLSVADVVKGKSK